MANSLESDFLKYKETNQEERIKSVSESPEVLKYYHGLFRVVYDNIPADERELLLSSPVEFVSSKLYFRGMSFEKVKELIIDGIMFPESGDYNGTAVFMTDSPVGAIGFLRKGSALAVVDPEKLDYLSLQKKIYDVASEEYQTMSRVHLLRIPIDERVLESYYMVDRWDTKSPLIDGRQWSNMAMRKPQPIMSVKKLIVVNSENKENYLIFDPSDEHDMKGLKEIYSCV